MSDRWDDFLEALDASPQEEALLKETAALFERLPEPHCSLSFRQELRENLLAEAAQKARQTERRRAFPFNPFAAWREKDAWRRTAAFRFAAAGILLFLLSLSMFNNTGPGPQGPAAVNEQEQTQMLAEAGITPLPAEQQPLQPAAGQAAAITETPGVAEPKPANGGPALAPATGTGTPAGATLAVPAPQPAQAVTEPGPDPAPVLPAEPEFDLFKNRRSFALAGKVLLNYGPVAEALYPVEKIDVNWEPNKIAPASTPHIFPFGTPEWAAQFLAREGFRVKAGETISVTVQETTQGLFAEIVYQVTPALVLHVHEVTDAATYYYLETGIVAPQGYYELITPAAALLQLQKLQSPMEAQQLRFSFREVRLTYHDFLLEEAGGTKSVRLPAYCFTGSELIQGKEGITFYLPAVK